MTNSEVDINPDMQAADRGEILGLMGPMLISESSRHRTALSDLAIELTDYSSGFRLTHPSR